LGWEGESLEICVTLEKKACIVRLLQNKASTAAVIKKIRQQRINKQINSFSIILHTHIYDWVTEHAESNETKGHALCGK